MIKTNKKIKLIYLKNITKKNKNTTKKNILKSIIQNNQTTQIKKIFCTTILNTLSTKKTRKTCLFGISNKWIDRKSKLSRFAIHKINFTNLNQNFKINEK